MTWSQLPPKNAAKFLHAVRSSEEEALFLPSLCEVHSKPLDFYTGASMVRIVNKIMIPHLLMDFISTGEQHFYLNGSDNAFHTLNAMGLLELNDQSVINYFKNYITYVYERGNSLEIDELLTPDNTTIEHDEETESYTLTAPLHFRGGVVETKAHISSMTGAINITTPLQVSFLESPNPKLEKALQYRHPLEDNVVKQARELLASTQSGQRLLELGDTHKVPIRIFCSPNYHGYVTNDPIIYLLMPAAEQNAKYMQALCLAGALRDVEQIIKGYGHPDPVQNKSEVYAHVNLAKNLDMALEMCKIVDEWLDQGFSEGFSAFEKLGLKPVYEGFKAGQSKEKLFEIYLDAIEKTKIIRRV